jgi:hypothetical protein
MAGERHGHGMLYSESALMLPFIEKQRTKIQYFITLKPTATKIDDFIKQVNQIPFTRKL